MKLAIAGKGGSGKTSISGTMARLFARRGHNVLAIDGDSNPNLALTLGVDPDLMDAVPTLPADLLRRTTGGIELTRPFDEIAASHSLDAPDGVRLLVMALPKYAGTGCLCSMHAVVKTLIGASPAGEHDVTILDTEASPEQFSRGTTEHADMVLTVVEPYYKSMETARRMAALALDLGIGEIGLVANKVRDEYELEAVREFAETNALRIAAVIPFDDTMQEAERARSSPFDFDAEAPAIAAINELIDGILAGGKVPAGSVTNGNGGKP
ncbi:MAG: AAA family ATPase [Thermoleophilaceae bacterium]